MTKRGLNNKPPLHCRVKDRERKSILERPDSNRLASEIEQLLNEINCQEPSLNNTGISKSVNNKQNEPNPIKVLQEIKGKLKKLIIEN